MTATVIGVLILAALFIASLVGNAAQFKDKLTIKKDKETIDEVNKRLNDQNQVLSDRNRKSTLDSLSDGSF